jgi:intraflagellar transport protein 74
LDQDLDELQSERNQKYRELRKREETMDAFLAAFEDNRTQELQRMADLEAQVETITTDMSRNMEAVAHLPSSANFSVMKADLAFKAGETERSRTTLQGLEQEHTQLQANLEKVGTLNIGERNVRKKSSLSNEIRHQNPSYTYLKDANNKFTYSMYIV